MKLKIIAITLSIALAGAVGYIVWMKFKPRKKHTKEEAYTEAQEVIKSRLKSPGSAQFSDPYVAQMDDTTFMCSGDVDCQNGFGGLRRAYWSVSIRFMPSSMVSRHHAILESRDDE